jgi:hypothetical protein
MARSTPRQPKREKKQQRQEDEFTEVVKETTLTFTSSSETAHDFHWQCEKALDELRTDVLFNTLAYVIWQEHAENANELSQALGDFLAERERHQSALAILKTRFEALIAKKTSGRLEPLEFYANLVRKALTPQDHAATDA